MIIECPSCNTKFAVDGQQLAEVENPRFHCSRCGHLFEPASKDSSASGLGIDNQPSTATGVTQTTSQTEDEEPYLNRNKKGKQLELLNSEETSVDNADDDFHPSSGDRLPMVSWPGQNTKDDAYEADLRGVKINIADSRQGLDLASEEDDHLAEEIREFSREIAGRGPKSNKTTSAPIEIKESKPLEPQALSGRDYDQGTEQHTSSYNRWDNDPEDLEPERQRLDEFEEAGELEDPQEEDCGLSESEIIQQIARTLEEEVDQDDLDSDQENEPQWSLTDDDSAPPATGPSKTSPRGEYSSSYRWPDENQSEILGGSSKFPQQGDRAAGYSETELDQPDENLPKESSTQRRSALRRAKREERLLRKVDPNLKSENRTASNRPTERGPLFPGIGAFYRSSNDGNSGFLQNALVWVMPLLFIWSLPMLLLFTFGLWKDSIARTPDLVKDLLHLHTLELQKLPPSGLELVDIKSEFVTLDDGNKVLEINGNLVNATVAPYRDIRLEAKTFTAENKELNNLVIDLKNGLVGAKLPALKQESIESHQSKRGTGRNEIKPNGRFPFRIILTGISGNEVFYSARVYSVLDG